MRICMAASNVGVYCDVPDKERVEIASVEELDRHIRALQKAREWLVQELELKEKKK